MDLAVDIGITAVFLMVFPFATAYVADRKGGGVVPWALIGLFFPVLGLLFAAVVPRAVKGTV